MHQSPDPDAPDPHLGRELGGRFVLDRRLGVGAMGFVYRAVDRQSGGQAAVKILRPDLMGDWSVVERFEREARAVRAVHSPHVVRILGHGESDGLSFIAMELLDGESLGARLERAGPMPVHLAVRTARAVADALSVAHAAGVVHRDLKPENVMLTADGDVKVVDFGIARVLEGSEVHSEVRADAVPPLTLEGTIIGTPMYLSPEGASRSAVGPPADLYALGVILFETLAGSPPFVDESPMEVIAMHLRSRPPPLDRVVPGVPPALAALVGRMLDKKPARRPTAVEVRDALDALSVELDATLPARALPEGEAPDTLEERPLASLLDDEDTTSERAVPPGVVPDDATTVERPAPAPSASAIHSMATAVPRRGPRPAEPTWVVRTKEPSRAPLIIAIVVGVLLLVAFAALLLTGAG